MHPLTYLALAAVATVALAGGQYYVPRAYYTIDAEGHESIPVPLRRLRRSPIPIPVPNGRPVGDSWSNSASGSSSWSNSNSGSNDGGRGWNPPSQNGYGASAPSSIGGPGGVHVMTASASAGVSPGGQGYYGTKLSYNPPRLL